MCSVCLDVVVIEVADASAVVAGGNEYSFLIVDVGSIVESVVVASAVWVIGSSSDLAVVADSVAEAELGRELAVVAVVVRGV